MYYLSSVTIAALSSLLVGLPTIAETTAVTNFTHSTMLVSQRASVPLSGRWTLANDPQEYVELVSEQGQYKVIVSSPGLGDPFEHIGILNGSEIQIPQWEAARCGPGDCTAKLRVSPDGNNAELIIFRTNGKEPFSWGEYQRSNSSSEYQPSDNSENDDFMR
jgi:hypothetical protein